MSDEFVLRQCAPTFCAIKTGNLFPVKGENLTALNGDVRKLNHQLLEKGVRIIPLGCKDDLVLLYAFRPARLERDLSKPQVQELLARYGYRVFHASSCVSTLAWRFAHAATFPHEVGLFLGYPEEDVRHFIEEKGKGAGYTGCWKAYGDEEEAKQTSFRFKRCRECSCERFRQGCPLSEIVVKE